MSDDKIISFLDKQKELAQKNEQQETKLSPKGTPIPKDSKGKIELMIRELKPQLVGSIEDLGNIDEMVKKVKPSLLKLEDGVQDLLTKLNNFNDWENQVAPALLAAGIKDPEQADYGQVLRAIGGASLLSSNKSPEKALESATFTHDTLDDILTKQLTGSAPVEDSDLLKLQVILGAMHPMEDKPSKEEQHISNAITSMVLMNSGAGVYLKEHIITDQEAICVQLLGLQMLQEVAKGTL